MLVWKRPWVFICIFCVCVCCGSSFVSLLGQVQVRMPLQRDLVWEVCAKMCVCLCVSVRPYVDACKKKSMGVSVCFLCMCVLFRPPLWLYYGVPSVDASTRDLVRVLCLCVCVVCVCEAHCAWVQKKDHQSLCVSLVWLCDVETSFVNMFGGAKCGCLCRRPNVSVHVWVCVCVRVCVRPMWMPIGKRPWVFVCLCCGSVCCEDHLVWLFGGAVSIPLLQTYYKCCVYECVCLCLCEALCGCL